MPVQKSIDDEFDPEIIDYRITRGPGELFCHVNLIMPSVNSPRETTLDYCDEENAVNISLALPNPALRHAALGEYIDQWGLLEAALHDAARSLMNNDQIVHQAVLAPLNSKDLADLVKNLGKARLNEETANKLDKICWRFGKAATVRNRLIHAQWIVEIFVTVKDTKMSVIERTVRFYMPPNRELENLIWDIKNQKIRAKHIFTLRRLQMAAAQVRELRKDVRSFLKNMPEQQATLLR